MTRGVISMPAEWGATGNRHACGTFCHELGHNFAVGGVQARDGRGRSRKTLTVETPLGQGRFSTKFEGDRDRMDLYYVPLPGSRTARSGSTSFDGQAAPAQDRPDASAVALLRMREIMLRRPDAPRK